MSGLKISVQEINRIRREQLQLKAEQKAREAAKKRELNICIECGKETLRAYIDELHGVLTDMEQFTVNDKERQQMQSRLDELLDEAEGNLGFIVFDDDEKGLEEYRDIIRKCNKTISQELKKVYKAIEKWHRRQEKADEKADRIQAIEAEELKKLEHKQEMLHIEEQNEAKNILMEYEREYIHDAVEEAMEEIGCELIGVKNGDNKEKQEEVFSYQEGVAIHVIEQNCQITMEVVATDTVSRKPSESEQEMVQSLMYDFEGQYSKIQECLNRKGISPKSGSEMILPPSRSMVRVENISNYDTERSIAEEIYCDKIAKTYIQKNIKKETASKSKRVREHRMND